MSTTVGKKRKIIDLDPQTFKILSIKAASTGTNLKSLIEKLLVNMAESIEDAELYSFLVSTDPEEKLTFPKFQQTR